MLVDLPPQRRQALTSHARISSASASSGGVRRRIHQVTACPALLGREDCARLCASLAAGSEGSIAGHA
jgi:hypothetical protein